MFRKILRAGRLGALALLASLPAVAQQAAEEKKLAPPRIRLIEVRTVPNTSDHLWLVFEAANPNDRPVPFIGYTTDSFSTPLAKGTISPLYKLQYRRGGKWADESMGWCGTGRGQVQIAAKSKVTFTVLAPKSGWEAMKVGLAWQPSEKHEGQWPTAWSDAVTFEQAQKRKKG